MLSSSFLIAQNKLDSLLFKQYFKEAEGLVSKRNISLALKTLEKADSLLQNSIGLNNMFYAHLLSQRGRCQRNLGKNKEAESLFLKAIDLAINISGPFAKELATFYYNVAFCQPNNPAASIYFEKSFQVMEKYPVDTELADTRFKLCYRYGWTQREMGQFDKAITLLNNAVDLAPDMSWKGWTAIELSIAYRAKGNFRLAIDFYKKAEEFLRLANDIDGITPVYHGIAKCYNEMDDYFNAAFFYRKALNSLKERSEVGSEEFILIYSSLAETYHWMGRSIDAAVYIDSAAYFSKKHNLELSQESAALYMIAAKIFLPSDIEKASTNCEKSIKILQNSKSNQTQLADAYNIMGRIKEQKKDFDGAIEYYQKTLEIFLNRYGEKSIQVSRVLVNVARIKYKQKDFDGAIEYYQNAAKSQNYKDDNDFTAVSQIYELIAIFNGIGKCNRMANSQQNNKVSSRYLSDVKKYTESSILAIDYHLSHMKSSLGDNVIENFRSVIAQAIELAALSHLDDSNSNYFEKALNLLEKHRRIEIYSNNSVGKYKIAGVPDSVIDNIFSIKARVKHLTQALQEKEGSTMTQTTPSEISDIEKQLNIFTDKLDALHDKINMQYNFNKEVSAEKHDSIKVSYLQKKILSSDQGLVEYFQTDSSILIFILSKNVQTIRQIKLDFPLNEWISQFSKYISNSKVDINAYANIASKLYQKLVAPINEILPKRLIIVPHGIFNNVVFDALVVGNNLDTKNIRFMIHDHAITYCHSIHQLFRDSQNQAKTYHNNFSAFIPFGSTKSLKSFQFYSDIYDETQMNLIISNKKSEAEGSAKINQTYCQYGGQTTGGQFFEKTNQSKVLHIGTGIYFNKFQEKLSYIAFPNSLGKVEKLNFYNIENLHLNNKLLILSAFKLDSILLQNAVNLGAPNLVDGFHKAGVDCLILSMLYHEGVNNREILKLFHGGLMRKEPVDLALQQSKIAFIEQKKSKLIHPIFWASLNCFGRTQVIFE